MACANDKQDPWCNNSEHRKEQHKNLEINKPYTAVQYNKFMKGIDRADQYLSYYKVLRKTIKWLKKVVLYLLKCVLQCIFCLQN
jgi:hypothetical protein